jgi:hypothetical protein
MGSLSALCSSRCRLDGKSLEMDWRWAFLAQHHLSSSLRVVQQRILCADLSRLAHVGVNNLD